MNSVVLFLVLNFVFSSEVTIDIANKTPQPTHSIHEVNYDLRQRMFKSNPGIEVSEVVEGDLIIWERNEVTHRCTLIDVTYDDGIPSLADISVLITDGSTSNQYYAKKKNRWMEVSLGKYRELREIIRNKETALRCNELMNCRYGEEEQYPDKAFVSGYGMVSVLMVNYVLNYIIFPW